MPVSDPDENTSGISEIPISIQKIIRNEMVWYGMVFTSVSLENLELFPFKHVFALPNSSKIELVAEMCRLI